MRTAPQPATSSSSARQTRGTSQAGSPRASIADTARLTGSSPVWKFGWPRWGSGSQVDRVLARVRTGARYTSGLVSGVNQPWSAAITAVPTSRPRTR